MLRALPERRAYGIGLVIYASLVAVATVYGRYHYAVDAVAGVGIALLARQLTRRRNQFTADANSAEQSQGATG
jgi:membrane-associated phospholipid phosphatase